MKFVATIKVVYDVDPKHYKGENGDATEDEMLAIDRENLADDPHAFVDFDDVTTTLEKYTEKT
jgi:hypothetical protein